MKQCCDRHVLVSPAGGDIREADRKSQRAARQEAVSETPDDLFILLLMSTVSCLLFCSSKPDRVTGAAAGPEPAYSLYSTDSEDQVMKFKISVTDTSRTVMQTSTKATHRENKGALS